MLAKNKNYNAKNGGQVFNHYSINHIYIYIYIDFFFFFNLKKAHYNNIETCRGNLRKRFIDNKRVLQGIAKNGRKFPLTHVF